MTGPNHSPWGQPAPDPRKQPPPQKESPPPVPSPYDRPQYGAAPHPQPPYAQPPYDYGGAPPPPPYPYGGYPQPTAGTNGLAIASLVLAFFCSVAGLVCGIVALNQIKQRPQPGRGLAIAGIALSVSSLLFVGVFFTVGLAMAATY